MAFIDRVKYEGKPEDLVWKYPADNLSTATQLIVNESQEAVLFREGKGLDVFGPGRHTLSTHNIPGLRTLINLPFGGETPFTAEVYYVSKATVPDLKFGTRAPMMIMDPRFNILVPVRCFGIFGLRITDAKSFVTVICGQNSIYTTESISTYLKGAIITRIKDYIAEVMIKQKVSVVEISAYLEEVSTVAKAKLAGDFKKYGLEITDFFIQSIDTPEEDETVKRLRDSLSTRADIDILGQDNYRMKRSFDTMETAAGNEGGGAGQMMGAGMGLGMGFGVGNMVPGMVGSAMGGMQSSQPQAQEGGGQMQPCPKCGKSNPLDIKFCPECGTKNEAPGALTCPACSASVPAGSKFCPSCGQKVGSVACIKCGTENASSSKFCSNCGNSLSAIDNT